MKISPVSQSTSAWNLLNEPGGPQWRTYNRDYVPVGLLELIPFSPETVLDVGCFCGASGAWLKAKYPGVRVVGIEPVKEAAKVAAKKLDAVQIGNLEEIDLADSDIIPGSVDVVILADVLEHMYNPWQALVALRPLLAPKGIVLASIPNIRNFKIINDLAQGEFSYVGAGILDITHIRFFTMAGVHELFRETGYNIEQIRYNIDPRCRQLMNKGNRNSPMDIDSTAIRIKNLSREQVRELATLQFWLRASPNNIK